MSAEELQRQAEQQLALSKRQYRRSVILFWVATVLAVVNAVHTLTIIVGIGW